MIIGVIVRMMHTESLYVCQHVATAMNTLLSTGLLDVRDLLPVTE